MSRVAFTLRVLLSHWARHPMQLATLLVGLAAATALWSGVQAINAQARTSYDRAAASFGGANAAMLVPAQASSVPQSMFTDLRRAGWLVSPMVEGRIRVAGRSVRIIGIEPLSLPRGAGPAPSVGETALQDFLAPGGQTLIGAETARQLSAREGDALAVEDGSVLPPLHVAFGLAPNLLVMDIGFAQQILKTPDRISRFLLDPGGASARAPLREVAGENLRLVEAGAETDLERLTASFHHNLTAFGLLSFLVGLFIVHSAIGLAFEQRLPMLRTLRACGLLPGELVALLVAELVLLALFAGAGGVVCGYLIASSLLPDVAASLRGLYGASVPGELAVAPQWWLAGMGMSVAGALVAAVHALIKVFRMPLLVSAQPVAWQEAQQRWLVWQGGLALTALAAAAACLSFGESLIAGFAVLAGILLGAALLLPLLLSIVLRLGEQTSRRPVALWAWADSRQQLSGLSLALMAMLLALAVNVGVGTMVNSFEKTFNSWLEGRLSSELYVVAKDSSQAGEIERWLRDQPGVQAILPSARAETRLVGEVIELLGLSDHATYRDRWPLLASLPNVWDGVRDGTAALVSEQLGRRLGLHIGNELRISTTSGAWVVRVGGFYADYGNPKGQIIVNADQLVSRFDDAERARFGVRVAPDSLPSLLAALDGRFGGAYVADQASSKAEARRLFGRTFAVTAALNAFTLGVAGIALFTSLLTLGQARLPQLAPLWAIGLTRRQIAGLELAKTVALAMLTALLALPLGILVAWCLIEVVNVKAFGWRLPLSIFPGQLLQLLAVAILAALLATLLPAIRLARTKPIALLKIFADER